MCSAYISFSCKSNSFHANQCTRIRFETEAQGNSEKACFNSLVSNQAIAEYRTAPRRRNPGVDPGIPERGGGVCTLSLSTRLRGWRPP